MTVPCQRAPICRRPADYCDARCPEHKKPSGPEVDAEAWAARNAPPTCREADGVLVMEVPKDVS